MGERRVPLLADVSTTDAMEYIEHRENKRTAEAARWLVDHDYWFGELGRRNVDDAQRRAHIADKWCLLVCAMEAARVRSAALCAAPPELTRDLRLPAGKIKRRLGDGTE